MSETKQAWKGLGGAMKKVWAVSAMPIVVVLIIIGAALALGYRHFTQAAVVNGSVISRFDVIKELENSSGQAALEGLVTKKLITQAAVKAGIKVSSNDIDADVKDIEEKIAIPIEETNQEEETLVVRKQRNTLSNNDNNEFFFK
jgi:hypothetical protein